MCLYVFVSNSIFSLSEAVAACAPCRIRVHSSEFAPELHHNLKLAREFASGSVVSVVEVAAGSEGRDAVGETLLRRREESGGMQHRRTGLMIHRGFTVHGMLAKTLGPSGALAAIVNEAVQYSYQPS